MDDARLTSAMLAGLLIRRAQSEGGFAMVLAKGDPTSGVILIQTAERGVETGLFERIPDYEKGGYRLIPCGGADPAARADYLDRRRKNDRDLWIIELDVPNAEQFAAETIC